MQNDNAAFHNGPSDPTAFTARPKEKAVVDMANATPVSQTNLQLVNFNNKTRDAEADEYEPYDHREVDHPLSNFDVLFHMMKASCGSGILAMPQAFLYAGYVVGLVGTAAVGFICTYCVHILIQSEHAICRRRKVASLSYHEIARESFLEGPPFMRKLSKTAEYSEHIFLSIYQLGTMSVYTVFVASNIKSVVDAYGTHIDVRIYMCMLLVPFILINWIRNLKYLAPFSTFALAASVLAFGVALSYVFSGLPSISTREPVGEIQNLPLFFGIVIFALEAIGVVVPLGNEMKQPRKYLGALGVLNQGMIPIVLLYIFLGFFGYIKYGEKASGSITLDLPEHEVLAQSVKVLIAIAIFGTHPLQCYVVIDIVWGTYLQPRFEKHPNVLTIEYAVRTGLVLFAFLFAVAIPNLGPFISLVGALSLSVVGIMLPAIIQLCTFWYHCHGVSFYWLLTKNSLLALFALVGLVSGTYASILEIVKAQSES